MIKKWFIPLYAKIVDGSTAPKLEEADIAVKNAVEKQIKNENVLSMEQIGKKRYVRNAGKPLQLKALQVIFARKHAQ